MFVCVTVGTSMFCFILYCLINQGLGVFIYFVIPKVLKPSHLPVQRQPHLSGGIEETPITPESTEGQYGQWA